MKKKYPSDNYVTKSYLDKRVNGLDKKINDVHLSLNGRMDGLDGRMDSLDGRIDSLDGRIDSLDGKIGRRLKQFADEFYTRIDPILAEVENARVDRELSTQKDSELEDKINNHEQRIKVLEKRAN